MRTGVTAIFPRGTNDLAQVFAGGWFSLNGNGEMTGTAWLDDYGLLLYPITITNTNSVGTVRDAVIEWGGAPGGFPECSNRCLPAVAETWDGNLSLTPTDFTSLMRRVCRPGGGPSRGRNEGQRRGACTGMQCLGFKGGIGTASRRLPARAGGFTVGVLVPVQLRAPASAPRRGGAGGADAVDENSADKALTARTPAQANKLWAEAQTFVMKDAGYVPINVQKWPIYHSARLQGCNFFWYTLSCDVTNVWIK